MAFSALLLTAPAAVQTPSAPASPSAHEAVIKTYCVTCHNDRARTGALSLEHASLATAPREAEMWEKVIRKVRSGMMPPPGLPRPAGTVLDDMAAYIESSI